MAVTGNTPVRASWLAAAWLTLAALLAYANSWSVPFLFDDMVTIVDNPTIRAPGSLAAALSPAAHTGVGGRPLAHLSLVLNHLATGEAVQGHHGVNLAIHIFAALAFFGLVRRTLLLPRLAPRFGSRAWGIAFAAAGLWLLHPVQTQSVTYVSQRTESLMGLWYFVTLYAFVRGVEGSGRAGWLVLSVAACFAGVASKEVMVTAPVVVLLYDCVFVSGSACAAWRRRWGYYAGLGASWLVLAMLMRGLGGRGVGFGLGFEWWRYLLTGCRAIVGYLGLAVWPHPLVFDYGNEIENAGIPEFVSAGIVCGLGVLAVVGLLRRPMLGFLTAWFLLTLAPTSTVVPIPLQPIAENRLYVPLAAVAVSLVLLVGAVVRRAGRYTAVGTAAALVALTLARNTDYRSEVAIWSDTVAKRPGNARAHHNLGNALRDAGRLPEAERKFLEALRLRPGYSDAEAALAGVVARLGRLDDAVALCHQVLQREPNSVVAHNNLGGALWQKGDLAGAIAAYEIAVRLQPGYAEAHTNLANVLLKTGRFSDAVVASEAALRAKPKLAAARFSLGAGLAGLGRLEEARSTFQHLVRIHPGNADAHVALGEVSRRCGNTAEAVAHFEAALQLNPSSTVARLQLAELRNRPPQ